MLSIRFYFISDDSDTVCTFCPVIRKSRLNSNIKPWADDSQVSHIFYLCLIYSVKVYSIYLQVTKMIVV